MTSNTLDSAANALVADVLANNVHRVERRFAEEELPWKEVISYELALSPLLSAELKDNNMLLKLISFEIHTLSIWHLAALFGYTDMVVNFLDKDIPVNLTTASGTTALHLASFGGHCSTVRVLTFVYRANINCTDKYDWSPLHYAAAGGNIDVVQMLIDEGCDIQCRDKDGTTAAFRADVEGHINVAKLLIGLGGPELLEVKETSSPVCYSGGSGQTTVFQFENPSSSIGGEKIGNNLTEPEVEGGKIKSRQTLPRQHSTPDSKEQKNSHKLQERSNTLPAKHTQITKHRSIRRLIRQQLEEAFNPEPLYEIPIESNKSNEKKKEIKLTDVGFGMNTLKGILKEEILNYKIERESQNSECLYERVNDDHDNESLHSQKSLSAYNFDCVDDEPPYEMAPPPPPIRNPRKSSGSSITDLPPPLPPRRLSVPSLQLEGMEHPHTASDSDVLLSAIKLIAPKLGNKWQNVARALPIHSNKKKAEERIQIIVKLYSANAEKQAMAAMSEWMINQGHSACIGDIIKALQTCGLKTLIKDVQTFTQEFSA